MLKWFAIAAMVADHVGVLLFPDQLVFRWLGRFAMPIFCVLIAVGAIHTRSRQDYIYRLLLFGLIAQPVFVLVLGYPWTQPNVLFTLAMGVLSTYGGAWLALALVLSVPTGYGVAAVVVIYGSYRVLIGGDSWAVGFGAAAAGTVFLNYDGQLLPALVYAVPASLAFAAAWWFQTASGLRVDSALPAVNRWLFYWFYPAHLIVVGTVAAFLG